MISVFIKFIKDQCLLFDTWLKFDLIQTMFWYFSFGLWTQPLKIIDQLVPSNASYLYTASLIVFVFKKVCVLHCSCLENIIY